MIYQDYLPGEEFTIDVLSDMDSNPLISVPRIRFKPEEVFQQKVKYFR